MRREKLQQLLDSAAAHRVLLVLWIVWLVTVIAGSLIPSTVLARIDPAEAYLNDKQQHFLAYLGLAVLPPLLWRGQRLGWLLSAAMLILGILLEYAQRLTPDRQFEGADMVADGLGVLTGMLLSGLLLWLAAHRRPAAPRPSAR